MKYTYITICMIILLLIGCAPEVQEEEILEEIEEPIIIDEPEETPLEEPEVEIYYDDEEDTGAELEEDGAEEILPEQEKPELSEKEELQQILGYAKTKINSYLYKYRGPSNKQYYIYVKDNKIKLDYLSSDNDIYIDTEKKTAEEYCTTYSRCGRQTGKIADLDYYDTYIDTPIDWLNQITDSEKIDEGVYYGKQSWTLNTNIGKVTIDSNFGFIYEIKQEDKAYIFSEAKFNAVKDSDVNIPEHLLPE